MKVLITGLAGMLGRALCDELSKQHEIIGLDLVGSKDIIRCDITAEKDLRDAFAGINPEIVVHCAAYTDVNGCELNPKKAEAANAQGAQNVALACKDFNCRLIYISTDFVFDGTKNAPYTELDKPNPINVYGRSKLAGEEFIRSILGEAIIVRSSWLFGAGGKNFVDAILEKDKKQKQVEVVNDQFGSPTYVNDLAGAIGKLINLGKEVSGIYHITNSGSCSWYEFANEIKKIAVSKIEIVAVSTEHYDSPTQRPKMSVLDNSRYQVSVGRRLRSWQEALRDYILR